MFFILNTFFQLLIQDYFSLEVIWTCKKCLQVAIKNNIDVFYFACIVPIHVFFAEDGNMEKKVFLATWKDIPAQNEVQFTIQGVECNAGKNHNESWT